MTTTPDRSTVSSRDENTHAEPPPPSRRRGRKLLAGGLLAATAAGAILVPATAAYSAAPRTTQSTTSNAEIGVQDVSRGFDFYNLSSQNLTFGTPVGPGDVALPAVGSVLKPGGVQHAELVYWFGSPSNWKDVYWGQSNGAVSGTRIALDDFAVPYWKHTFAGSGLTVKLEGTKLYFLDASASQRDIPASDGQAQAETLRQLCLNSNQAKCTFTPTTRERVAGKDTMVTEPVTYSNSGELSREESTTVGQSDSLQIELTAGGTLFNIVELGLRTQYEHTWTVERTYRQQITQYVNAGDTVWITHRAPMIRDTGDFTITLGNTTWRLHDVYFDSPDPAPPVVLPPDKPKYGFFVHTVAADGKVQVQRAN